MSKQNTASITQISASTAIIDSFSSCLMTDEPMYGRDRWMIRGSLMLAISNPTQQKRIMKDKKIV